MLQSIGERIKQARLALGYSQRELARRAGSLSAMAVSRYENGHDIPGSGVLLRLSSALGVRFEYFFRPVAVELAELEYRKRSAFPEKKQVSIRHQAVDALERYLTIEEAFGPRAFPPPTHQRASEVVVRAPEVAERAARKLRKEWELGDDPIENLCEVLEDRGVKVMLVDAAQGFDGFKCWANGDIPVIGVRREGSFGDRQRFSMAHELGHLLLTFPDGTGAKQREAAAYRFAGAFLVPESAVRRQFPGPVAHLSIPVLYSLKHKWGFSMQAWARRLLDLNSITSATYRRFCIALKTTRSDDGVPWSQREPGKQVTPEITRRFERLVEQAVAQDLVSVGKAADLLGRPLVEVRQKMKWPQEVEAV